MSSPLYITTIDTNGFLCPNIRASHEHAANRWGCNYNVITRPCGDRTDTFGIKLQSYRFPYPAGARVMYIDADAAIREDCPSPFLIDEHKFLAVDCLVGEGRAAAIEAVTRSYERHASALAKHAPGRAPADPYFNGGVMVYTPERHNIYFALADTLAGQSVGGMDEQTLTNIAVPHSLIHWLPREYNFIGPEAIRCSPHMPAYIVHYAGKCMNRKRELCESVTWRV